MSFGQKLSEVSGINENLLPASYQIIGDVLLLKFMRIGKMGQKKRIATAILDLFPYVKTVCEISKIEHEFRTPRIRKLAGGGTETVHKEHGILYKLDASRIMFSKGNLFERQRLIKLVKANETIVDMFAGIGYFSLGLARKAKKVIAIEKNPVAFSYLKENIKLNKINNIEPILDDCRRVSLSNVADRIIMGYFPDTEQFLPFAVNMMKRRGMIHFHNTYRKRELWHVPMKQIEGVLNQSAYRIIGKRVVKSVAPNTYHVVLDIAVNDQRR